MSTSTIQIRPVVLELLRQAHLHVQNCEGQHAEMFFRAAAAADLSPLALIEYGGFLIFQGQLEAALLKLKAGWESAKLNQSPILRALACHHLSEVYRQLEEWPQAKQFQQLAIAAELDALDLEQANCISSEAVLNLALSDYFSGDEALAARSFAQLLQAEDREVQSCSALNLAEIWRHQGKFAAAMTLAKQAYAQAVQDRNGVITLQALTVLSRILLEQGFVRRADACLQQAVRMSERFDQAAPRTAPLRKAQRYVEHMLATIDADPSLN